MAGGASLCVGQVTGSDGTTGTFVAPTVANITVNKTPGGKLLPMQITNDGAQLCKTDGGPFVSGARPVYENFITITGGAAAVSIGTLDSGLVYAALSSGRSIGFGIPTGLLLVTFINSVGGGLAPATGAGYPITPTTPLWVPVGAAGAMQFYSDTTIKVSIIVTP